LAEPTPGIKALLTQAETIPDYVDDDLIDNGSRPHFVPPQFVHHISLSAGALVRVYSTPAIASVLAATGKLFDMVSRRLGETGKWVNTAMIPGSMRIGGPGYVATMQIRMLHAQVRRYARERGYAGVPISQLDLARTWLDFTVTSYRAEERIGYAKTAADLESLYRYWWYLAHVLGIDARLVEGISDNESALRADKMFQAVTGPANPESGALAQASLKNVATGLHNALSIPQGLATQAMYALTRRFHGEAFGDSLGLPKAWAVRPVLALAIAVARFKHRKVVRDPEARRRAEDEGIAVARALSQVDQGAR
jgi:hypothetical protein